MLDFRTITIYFLILNFKFIQGWKAEKCNQLDGFITKFDKEATTEKSQTIKFIFCNNNVLQTKTIKIRKKNCFQDGIQHPGFPAYCEAKKGISILLKSCLSNDVDLCPEDERRLIQIENTAYLPAFLLVENEFKPYHSLEQFVPGLGPRIGFQSVTNSTESNSIE